MRRLLPLFALVCCGSLFAAELKQITPPAGQSMAVIQAPSTRGAWVVRADEDLGEVQPQVLADGSLCIVVAKPGKYLVRWRQGPLGKWQASTLDLGGTVPPGPQPPPVPPKPDPTPPKPPAPIPASGLWVLIVDDPLKHADLPQEQVDALTAKEVRDYLAAKCAKDEAKTPAFRIAAPGETFEKDAATWREAAAKVKDCGLKVPFWMISNGTTGTIEAFPADKASVLKRLKEFGG